MREGEYYRAFVALGRVFERGKIQHTFGNGLRLSLHEQREKPRKVKRFRLFLRQIVRLVARIRLHVLDMHDLDGQLCAVKARFKRQNVHAFYGQNLALQHIGGDRNLLSVLHHRKMRGVVVVLGLAVGQLDLGGRSGQLVYRALHTNLQRCRNSVERSRNLVIALFRLDAAVNAFGRKRDLVSVLDQSEMRGVVVAVHLSLF